ncbi:hypothetical protein [Streptococcus criceti]|nr:hypothetical protein [Streptococcus criceti]
MTKIKDNQVERSVKKNRTLAILGWSLLGGCSICLIFLGILTLALYYILIKPVSMKSHQSSSAKSSYFWTEPKSHDIEEYMDADYQFDWTLKEVKQLKINETSLNEVLKKHGKASQASSYDEDNSEIYLDYNSNDNDWQVDVHLTFKKNVFNKYQLTDVDGGLVADDIETVKQENPIIGWSREQFNQLIEGDYENQAKGGTSWKTIQKAHPHPYSAHYLFEYDETSPDAKKGSLSYKLEVRYGDDIDPNSIVLDFLSPDRGKNYYLSEKAGPDSFSG